MNNKEKDVSKLLGIIIVVALAACVIGAIVWFASTGKLKSNSLMFAKDNDEAPSHVTEMSMEEISENTSTLTSVMLENAVLYDCQKGNTLTFAEVLSGGQIDGYTLVDLNGDGVKDLVLKLQRQDANVFYVLLRNEHGVWGLEFPENGMETIYATGIYQGSDKGVKTYFTLQTSDEMIANKQIGDDTGTDFRILKDGEADLSAVSRVEFIKYINEKCGTMIQDYRAYSEEQLRKDLENPDGFDCVKEQELGPDYWSALICELPQYNDELGKTYKEFIRGDEEYYSEDAKWIHGAEDIFYCANLEDVQAIGTDDSIYDAEYVLFENDTVVMTGAVMDSTEAYVSDFIVDGSFNVEPAVFAIPGKVDNDLGCDALVWSCDDSYLVVFSTPDSREEKFYNRPAQAVCYVKKEHCGVTRYPIEMLPTMSAELE